MKWMIISMMLFVAVQAKAQTEKKIDYRQRSEHFFIAGSVSLAATVACVPGAYWIKYKNNTDAERTASLQTKRELQTISWVTGASALTCYAFAYINYRKAEKENQFGFYLLPNMMGLSYSF